MDVDYDNDLDVPVTIGRNREITRGGFMTLMHALHSEFPLDQNTHYEVLRVALNLKGADDA
jgi:hypothetical protein